MKRQNVFEDIAVLLCVLAAMWPVSALAQGHRSFLPLAATAVAIVGVGAALRRTRMSQPVGLAVQILAGVVIVACVTMLHGVSLAPSSIKDLYHSAQDTVTHSLAPLPATTAIVLMLVLAGTVVALVIDFVGGSSRMPLLAALPLAAPFVLVSTALGHALAPRYFIAGAVAWALLLFAQSRSAREASGRLGTIALFAAMAVIALVVALLVPQALPHRSTPALANGDARGVDTSVNFSENLDLSKSLRSRNSAPVLIYSTDSTDPAPLRVTTSSSYSGGVWHATASKGPFETVQSNSSLPVPGLDKRVPTTTSKVSVTTNAMSPPLVAAPAPLQAANFGNQNASFRRVTTSGVPYLTRQAPVYSVLYESFTSNSRPTSDADVSTDTPSVTADDLDTKQLTDDARTRLAALNEEATRGASTHFEKAVAIQRYLRTDPSFRYSLDLAPTKKVGGHDLDPLANFLETKQGYCTQFATAMIFAAREQGIPARMAIGFLPGTPNGNAREVHAADAHAWPELYFPGMGWTRFDPTPSSRSGEAPPYAPDTAPTSSASPSSSSSTSTSTSSSPSTSSSSSSTSTSRSTSTTPPAQHHTDDGYGWLKVVLTGLGCLAVLAGLLSILPLAGRAERRRMLDRATDERGKAEGHWHDMSWQLCDLGVALPSGRSPRETATLVSADPKHADIAPSFERATGALEEARYAARPGRSIGPATHRVVTAAKDGASWSRKVKALLFPASGVEFFARRLRKRR